MCFFVKTHFSCVDMRQIAQAIDKKIKSASFSKKTVDGWQAD